MTKQQNTNPAIPRPSLYPIFFFIAVTYFFASGRTTFSEEISQFEKIIPQSQESGSSSFPLVVAEANSDIIAPFFSPSVQHWSTQIKIWSEEYELDPNLIATVMQIESCGDPKALSGAGAAGLFQVMPFHFSEGEDYFDPPTNAHRGLSYLAKSFNTYGNIIQALAGYNGGITTASYPQDQWPDETKRYVYWGVNIYQDTVLGNEVSTVFSEWLGNGGQSLCVQAASRLGITP